jgi:hypothetical protein
MSRFGPLRQDTSAARQIKVRRSCRRVRSNTQCHGTRQGVRGSGDFTQKIQGWRKNRENALGSLATDPRTVGRIGATHGDRNRRRRGTEWLGKTTDQPIEEIGEFFAQ